MIGGLTDDKNNRELALEKRSYVLDELLKTERDYVQNLSMVVEGYLQVLQNPSAAEFHLSIPENLKTSQVHNIIFSNIKNIYEWHKNTFLKEVENYSALQPLKISNIFKDNESNFYMYTDYCQKNHFFNHFMDQYHLFFEEMRKFLNHMYPLRDLLIRPVKRIKIYTLLLQKMLKYSIQANLRDQLDDIQQAIDVMKRLTKNIDEMMIVDRFRNFNGSISDLGKMLMHGPLRCVVNPDNENRRKNRYKDLYVFLFERAMISTVEDGKKQKFINPSYVYKTKIKVNNMILKEMGDNVSDDTSSGPFLVESIDNNSPKMSIACQAYCAESRCVWLQKLRELLKAQSNFQIALRMPMECV